MESVHEQTGHGMSVRQVAPTVTVVVPAYNCAAFLARCLESLFAQTYPYDRYEIVLVDDGSTDGTAAEAREMAASWLGGNGRLRVIEKPNGGPASARNAGIGAATGQIVAFTDADCVADPDWLEQLVAVLAADPGAVAVGGPILSPPTDGWVASFLASTAFYRHRVRGGTVDYLLTANVAFRREAVCEVGGFCECDGAWGEDADLSFRLRQRGHHLTVTPVGSVTHLGAPPSMRALARELYRYGYGSSVLSRNWQGARIPAVEFARHGAAALLAPVLALRHAHQVGLRAAVGFTPLFTVEHGAFAVGLVHGETRRVARRLMTIRSRGDGGAVEASERSEPLPSLAAEWPKASEAREGTPRGGCRGELAESLPMVSVLMPVHNEAEWIARSLGAVLAQDYPSERLEVLLIDGASDDETLRVARALPGAERVRVLHNPRRVQAAGLNLGLRAARGEVVVRVDGHTVIASDYVRSCIAALIETGAANVGGRMQPLGITPAGEAIALVTTSRFGVPTAFHISATAQETDTVYLGAWPRAVLETLGGFDEYLRVNEDYDLNYRIRRAGGRIYLAPGIRSTYYGRQSFAALARQYFAYGAGKARMLRLRPGSLRPRQLVAPAFVAAVGVGAALAWTSRLGRLRGWSRLGWAAMVAAYAGLNLVATVRGVRRAHQLSLRSVAWRVAWRVPVAFFTVHAAWGIGFWAGLFARAPRRRDSARVSMPAATAPVSATERRVP